MGLGKSASQTLKIRRLFFRNQAAVFQKSTFSCMQGSLERCLATRSRLI